MVAIAWMILHPGPDRVCHDGKYGYWPDVTEEDLRQCIEDVTALKEAGKLWSPDVYEDMAFDFKNRNTVVKALCLHVAHTCNQPLLLLCFPGPVMRASVPS